MGDRLIHLFHALKISSFVSAVNRDWIGVFMLFGWGCKVIVCIFFFWDCKSFLKNKKSLLKFDFWYLFMYNYFTLLFSHPHENFIVHFNCFISFAFCVTSYLCRWVWSRASSWSCRWDHWVSHVSYSSWDGLTPHRATVRDYWQRDLPSLYHDESPVSYDVQHWCTQLESYFSLLKQNGKTKNLQEYSHV